MTELSITVAHGFGLLETTLLLAFIDEGSWMRIMNIELGNGENGILEQVLQNRSRDGWREDLQKNKDEGRVTGRGEKEMVGKGEDGDPWHKHVADLDIYFHQRTRGGGDYLWGKSVNRITSLYIYIYIPLPTVADGRFFLHKVSQVTHKKGCLLLASF